MGRGRVMGRGSAESRLRGMGRGSVGAWLRGTSSTVGYRYTGGALCTQQAKEELDRDMDVSL